MAQIWVPEVTVELPNHPESVTFRLIYLGKK